MDNVAREWRERREWWGGTEFARVINLELRNSGNRSDVRERL